jgi:3',5'-cyclic-AMP phosphodiesterase
VPGQKAIFYLFITVLTVVMTGCKKFESNPHEIKAGLPSEVHAANLRWLSQAKTDNDTVCFVVAGDSQRFYEQLDLMVKKINGIDGVDFFVLAGDITDFALAEEFKWVCDKLSKLEVPYFCAAGNHDLTANGEELYRFIFGPMDFAFTHKKHKFIIHNTNSRETGFNGKVPDLTFLEKELQDTAPDYFVGISHVPPFNVDFDAALQAPYSSLLASKKNFILSVHGHLHATLDKHMYGEHVRYIVTPALDDHQVYLMKISGGKIIKTTISF